MSIYATRVPSLPVSDPGYNCGRCGLWVAVMKIHQSRLCASCRLSQRAVPTSHNVIRYEVNGREMFCRSWVGAYDDDDNPIKDGRIYRPGTRICGHSDCVNAAHIVDTADSQSIDV